MKPELTPFQGKSIASTQELGSSKPTSQKKIEANRRNALRSTGPKTERGKATVSRNAVKHGLLASQTIITRGRGAENRQAFVRLLSEFREDYQPVGINEELLVERIATCYWRLARVHSFETGEIRKRLDYAVLLHSLEKIDEVNRSIFLSEFQSLNKSYGFEEFSIEKWLDARQGVQSSLRTHPLGIKYVMGVLVAAKTEIQEKGSLSNRSFERLKATSGFCDRSVVLSCISLAPAKDDMKKRIASLLEGRTNQMQSDTDDDTAQEKVAEREHAINALDRELAVLQALLDVAVKNTSLELDVQVKSLALPDDRATDKLLRYETQMSREIYRAMDQLERLQRRRKGENVPPPLNVNLGKRA